jgi:hypothetical protein
MSTTLNAQLIESFSNRYSENILNENTTFNKQFSANIASGSGVANTSSDVAFAGDRSLFLNNLSYTTTLVVNAGGDEWYTQLTPNRSTNKALIQFSIFNSSGIPITGRFNVYNNTVLLYILEYECPANQGWNTFFQNIVLPINDFDFSIELDADSENYVECYFDGIKLEQNDKNVSLCTPYSGYVYKTYESQETIDVPSISSNGSYQADIELIGASVGDFVDLVYPASLITDGLVVGEAVVTATDTVSFLIHNYSGGSVNPSSGVYKVKIIK